MIEQQPVLAPHAYFDTAMRLAFLLRGDIRGDGNLDDPKVQEAFALWWFLIGRLEGAQRPLSRPQREFLWAAETWCIEGKTVTVPRLLRAIRDLRPDVVEAVRLHDPSGVDRALGWLVLFGLDELALRSALGREARRLLDAVPEPSPSGAGSLTWLMRALWSVREDLQAAFDLDTEAGRAGLVAWFHAFGIREHRLEVLFAADDHDDASASAGDALGTRGCPEPARGRTTERCAVELVGHAFGMLGIGEDVRMMAKSLQAVGEPVFIRDFDPGPTAAMGDISAAHWVKADQAADVTVLCLTPFDTARFFLERGEAALRGKYIVGYWPWELPDWPQPWHVVYELVDEIWASSRFTQDAFGLTAPIPVIYMPMAVDVPAVPPLRKADLGLPEDILTILYVFDANSTIARKNPHAAVTAFRKAFPNGTEAVRLVLKTMNAKFAQPEWRSLLTEAALDPRVHVLNHRLDRMQTLALVAACDIYLSLHRSEGFGRTIAEAMLLQKPVVATAWSGSDELVTPRTAMGVCARLVPLGLDDYPWGAGSQWAEPSIDEAAHGLRLLANDAGLRQKLGAAGQAHVWRQHGVKTVGQRYRHRLGAIRRGIPGRWIS